MCCRLRIVGVVVKTIAVWRAKVTKRAGGKGGGGTRKKREMGNRRMTSNCGEEGRMKEEEMQWRRLWLIARIFIVCSLFG